MALRPSWCLTVEIPYPDTGQGSLVKHRHALKNVWLWGNHWPEKFCQAERKAGALWKCYSGGGGEGSPHPFWRSGEVHASCRGLVWWCVMVQEARATHTSDNYSLVWGDRWSNKMLVGKSKERILSLHSKGSAGEDATSGSWHSWAMNFSHAAFYLANEVPGRCVLCSTWQTSLEGSLVNKRLIFFFPLCVTGWVCKVIRGFRIVTER